MLENPDHSSLAPTARRLMREPLHVSLVVGWSVLVVGAVLVWPFAVAGVLSLTLALALGFAGLVADRPGAVWLFGAAFAVCVGLGCWVEYTAGKSLDESLKKLEGIERQYSPENIFNR